MRNKRTIRVFIFSIALIWCLGFLLPSILPSSMLNIYGFPLLDHAYSNVCHQVHSKTFSINGNEFLVCARCTGIYSGSLFIAFISLIYLGIKEAGIKLFIISSLLILADVLFVMLNIYGYSKIISFITGLFFGSVVFTYILTSIEILLVEKGYSLR